MPEICPFCGRECVNSQALRAHLKGCTPYQERKSLALPATGKPRERVPPASSLGYRDVGGPGDSPGTPEGAFDPVGRLRQTVKMERLGLELRDVREAHAERDRQAEAKERERQSHEERDVSAARVAEQARAEERQRRAEAAERKRAARRAVILDIKTDVVPGTCPPFANASEIKAGILEEIERRFAGLPIEDMDRWELIQIAESISTRICAKAREAQERAEQLTSRRRYLILHGSDYAERELRNVEGLDVLERWRIKDRIENDLQMVQGGESTGDVEEIVDDILDAEGLLEDDDLGDDDEEDEDE